MLGPRRSDTLATVAGPRRLEVSEIFTSIQGEGASAGQPCVFLRLAGCNLRCRWCDTAYAWDFARYDRSREVATESIDAVVAKLESSGPSRLVITGGEPLLQQPAVAAVLERLGAAWVVEVETNGTVVSLPVLRARVDQWNVSPKLSNSGEPEDRRLNLVALATLRDTRRAWLKLVVEDTADLSEVSQLIRATAWPKHRVLLMPQAATRAELRRQTPLLVAASAGLGYGLSPRLQVERWDGARGR